MRIAELFSTGTPVFSFEFFPPKDEDGVAALFTAIGELRDQDPSFVSVTYGAGGSSRDRTVTLAAQIKRVINVEVLMHLTCLTHTRAEASGIIRRLSESGITNVLALRGDAPPQSTSCESELRFAIDLVQLIRRVAPELCLGGACYPEGHIESVTREADLEQFKRKVDAGLDFAITQLFFDNAFYFDFVERARRAGITIPILPGIMPITNMAQIERFTRMCGATIPMRLALELERHRNDPAAVLQLGVAHATLQCADLMRRGAPGIHFYTLNRSRATRMILSALKSSLPPVERGCKPTESRRASVG